MKINEIFSDDTTSNLLPEEQYFSIENKGMIFDILRNKMYSNPILAICREITCNARDAHREVGTPDLPIQIYLPNYNDPSLKIKDFGPGISPERISNIFIKYAASTKRNDNIQTGGFGLGAKTPFSYSDSFNIITCFNGKKYTYICFIDETKIGKISLLNEENTSQPNGTEIVIPVKSNDFSSFYSGIEFATRHWSTRPVVKDINNGFSWKEKEVYISGEDWVISRSVEWSKNFKAIIDEIEYPIQLNFDRSSALNLMPNQNIANFFSNVSGDVLLYFKVGDLSLSASREQIYLDNATKDKLISKFEKIYNDFNANLQSKIDQCSNLLQANVLFSNQIRYIFKDFNAAPDLKWQNFSLEKTGRLEMPAIINTFYKNDSYYSSSFKKSSVRKETHRRLSLSENHAIVINDLNISDVTKKHIQKFWDINPKYTHIQVVSGTNKAEIQQIIKDHHLDMMSPFYLSNFTKPTVKRASSSTRLIIYKFDTSSRSFKQVPSATVDSDPNKKVLCSISRDYNKNINIFIDDKIIYHNYDLITRVLNNNPEYSLYAVDSSIPQIKIDNFFGEIDSISDLFEEILDQNQDIDFIKLTYCSNSRNFNFKLLNNFLKIENLISSNSILSKANCLKQELRQYAKEKSYLIGLYEFYNGNISDEQVKNFLSNNPENDLSLLMEKVENKYPLLSFIDDYKWDANISHITNYINLIDSNS